MLEHGTFSFKLEDNILIIEGVGPWNKEAIELSAEHANLVKRLRTQEQWGVIVSLYGDPIHTPEAAVLLCEYVKFDKQNGRVATALLLNRSSAPEFGKYHISNKYDQAGETFQFFENMREAYAWVKSHLQT